MARKIRKSLTLTEAPPFTPDSLREILARAVPKYALPGETEITELCGILNFWHSWFYRAQEERKFNALAAEARAAFDVLIKVMPGIWDDLTKRDALSQGQDQFTAWKLRSASALAPVLTPTGLGFLQPYSLPDQARDWRWLAGVLPKDIETALRPTNPTYRGGNTKGGPLSKILAAIIPEITGETVTAVAVGNQLG